MIGDLHFFLVDEGEENCFLHFEYKNVYFSLSFFDSFYSSFSEQTFLSCDRPCHHLDWPMICRVKLTLEVFQSLSK